MLHLIKSRKCLATWAKMGVSVHAAVIMGIFQYALHGGESFLWQHHKQAGCAHVCQSTGVVWICCSPYKIHLTLEVIANSLTGDSVLSLCKKMHRYFAISSVPSFVFSLSAHLNTEEAPSVPLQLPFPLTKQLCRRFYCYDSAPAVTLSPKEIKQFIRCFCCILGIRRKVWNNNKHYPYNSCLTSVATSEQQQCYQILLIISKTWHCLAPSQIYSHPTSRLSLLEDSKCEHACAGECYVLAMSQTQAACSHRIAVFICSRLRLTAT